MPTVPVTQGQEVREAPLPGVRVSTEAPAEAFGGGRSAEALQGAIEGLGQHTLRVADQFKKEADQVALQSADRQASDLETKLQVEASKMKGKDALGAQDYVAKNWDQGLQQINDSLTNSDQRGAFARAANARWESLNKTTQLHMASQAEELDKTETSGYIASSRAAAVTNAFDDSRVNLEVQRQTAARQDWAKRNGLAGTETEKALLMETQSNTYRDVIQARLDAGQDDKAQQLYEQAKGMMTEGDQIKVAAALKGSQIIATAGKIYDQVKGMKLPDGTPDEAKMRSVIFSMNAGPQEKEKFWDYVKARAAEDNANKNREDAARDKSFLNQVLQGKAQGVPLADALRFAQKSGKDPYDQNTYADAVQKIYSGKDVSDPVTKVNLWEKIYNGGSSKQEIDQAYNKGLLSSNDWISAREQYVRAQSGETMNPATKDAWDRVKVMAEEAFPHDHLARAKFMYVLQDKFKGTDTAPEQIIKEAQDRIKVDESTQWHFLGLSFGGQKQYQTDLQKRDQENQAWGQAYQEFGDQTVDALKKGIEYSTKKDAQPKDLEALSVAFGGAQNLKTGPVANAIQSIIKHRYPATQANIEAALKRYPDGKF